MSLLLLVFPRNPQTGKITSYYENSPPRNISMLIVRSSISLKLQFLNKVTISFPKVRLKHFIICFTIVTSTIFNGLCKEITKADTVRI